MKRTVCLILTAVLLALLPAALGEGNVLLCIGCTVDGQTSAGFEGTHTFIAVADDFDHIVGWRLNGVEQEGESFYYISFVAKGDTVIEAVYTEGDREAYLEAKAAETEKESPRQVVVRAVGAKLQYLNSQGVGAGAKYEEIDFSSDHKNPVTGATELGGYAGFKVTANREHGSQIAYWVINGVRYNFYSETMPTSITVSNLTQSMTIEVVYKGEKQRSKTKLTSAEIQAGRTGETMTVTTVNAQLAFIKNTFTRVSPYTDHLDFTNDYVNSQTKQRYKGGSCDIEIKANVDDNMLEKVTYWKFDDAVVVFSKNQARFSVQGLNHSITYTAVIDSRIPLIIYTAP